MTLILMAVGGLMAVKFRRPSEATEDDASDSFELREDGGFELREDGGKELRE